MTNENRSPESDKKSPIPWFNISYLEKVLQHKEERPVQIKQMKVESATSKGENYVSEINICKAEYKMIGLNTTKRISLIIKSQVENELISEICEDFNVFDRESQVYKVIMREFEQLLGEIGDDSTFGPKLIYADEKVIILENLKERNFKIFDVKNGLTYTQCEVFLEKLAKFHACSLVAFKKNPSIFKYHMIGNVTEKENPLHDLYKNQIKSCIDFCRKNCDLSKYVSKLEKLNDTIIEKMCEIFTRDSSGINLLNHGDAWCNNLMFQTNEHENVVDLIMVDYQEGYFGSLGIDWNYFIYTSWNKDLYLLHKDELIKYYYTILSATLFKLKYDNIPTLVDVFNEIKKKANHGLITATCILPILINELEELADPMNFLSDSDEAKCNRGMIFDNSNFIERLQVFLTDFDNNGIL